MNLLYLKTPNGQVIGMTEPLSPAIAKQWENGELVRVNEDGSAWSPPKAKQAPAAPKPAAAPAAPATPARPPQAAPPKPATAPPPPKK